MKRHCPILWSSLLFGLVRFSALLFVLVRLSSAQPSLPNAAPAPYPEQQFVDVNGKPLAGAFLCTYAAGTSTPQATYTDSTAGTPNTNPVVLDSSGRASIWVGALLYKFVMQQGGNGACPGTGTTLWTQDFVGDLDAIFHELCQNGWFLHDYHVHPDNHRRRY